MRYSQLFGETLRDAPAGISSANHLLLLRAAYAQNLGAGSIAFLHLGWLTIEKIKSIIRHEVDSLGAQQISMPASTFSSHGQNEVIKRKSLKDSNYRIQDEISSDVTKDSSMILDIVGCVIHSYKQMPRCLYHFQKKWRDDFLPRSGLLKLRNYETFEGWSISGNHDDLVRQVDAINKAYINIYKKFGIPVIETKLSRGKGEDLTDKEYYYLTPAGDETIMICKKCGYVENQAIARIRKVPPKFEEPAEIEKIATPQIQTIQSLADCLKIPKSKTAKAVFYIAAIIRGGKESEDFVFVVVRGDTEVNEKKLGKALDAIKLRKATDEEIKNIGATPGFASPLGIERGIVIVDDWIPISPNLVAGANLEGFHFLNVNYQRDYNADIIADIIMARGGDPCPNCGEEMNAEIGICIGRLTIFDESEMYMRDCSFLDKDGTRKLPAVGIYNLEIERLLGCIVEEHHDNDGLLLPSLIAPYQVHLVSLPGGEAETERIYDNLLGENINVFYDDRNESPGVKFKDADLMGMPLRITISSRSLDNGGAEWKERDQKDRLIVPIDELTNKIQQFCTEIN